MKNESIIDILGPLAYYLAQLPTICTQEKINIFSHSHTGWWMTQPAALKHHHVVWGCGLRPFNAATIVLWEYIWTLIAYDLSMYLYIINNFTKSRGSNTFWIMKCYSDIDAACQVSELPNLPASPPDMIKKGWALCSIKNTTEIQYVCIHHDDSIVSAECIYNGTWSLSERSCHLNL